MTLSVSPDADVPPHPDNAVTSSLGTGSALGTIDEQQAAGSFEVSHGTHSADFSLTMNETFPKDATVVDTQEAKSLHTSRTSTINGDEMGYDEHSRAGHLPSKQGSEQMGTPRDEIDWENDGEEDGEQHIAAPTPSGKRSRTNETESLFDGTGMVFTLIRETAANGHQITSVVGPD